MICKADKNAFFYNMEIGHYILLQIVQYFNWINKTLKYDHRFSKFLLYLFLLTEWISKFILGKVQKRHWSIHGTHQDTESIQGPEENKGPSLVSTSFVDANGQYNKLFRENLSIRFIITATTDGNKEVGQQGGRVVDSWNSRANIPLETAHRKAALNNTPTHGTISTMKTFL